MGIEDKPFRSYTWNLPIKSYSPPHPNLERLALDQGTEGACVGFAWAHEIAARPWSDPNITDDYAIAIYRWAQQNDEWPGENYSGTSVLAGAKAVTEWLSRIKEYRWAFGLDDVRRTIGYKGPVVLGINWYEGMFRPDSTGRIQPTGSLMGGHAILAYRVDERNKRIYLWNSWGQDWWEGGPWCFLTFEDLGRLLSEQGEACIPVVRR